MNRALLLAVLGLASVPVFAQQRPEEQYKLRVEYLEWRPDLSAEIQAGSFGTRLDLKEDLGIDDDRTFELHGVVQFAPGFKIRGGMTPLDYASDRQIQRSFVFNGQIYPVDTRVVSKLEGKLYNAEIEFDFVKSQGGHFGVLLGGEMFDGDASISAPEIGLDESEDLSTPVPYLGVTGRVYAGKLSFEGELKGLTIGSRGHFYELRGMARFHVSERIAVGGGYRYFKTQGEDEPDFVRFKQGGFTFGAELSL
jgi:hypothetical protein